mgnify:CR=1 FL=1
MCFLHDLLGVEISPSQPSRWGLAALSQGKNNDNDRCPESVTRAKSEKNKIIIILILIRLIIMMITMKKKEKKKNKTKKKFCGCTSGSILLPYSTVESVLNMFFQM